MLKTTVFLGISMVEQKNRRWLVTIIYTALLAVIMATILTYPRLPERYLPFVVQFPLIALILGWRIVRELVGDVVLWNSPGVLWGKPTKPVSLHLSSRRDEDEPDERDVLVRNAAYFRAYRLVAYYCYLAFLVFYVALPFWHLSYRNAFLILLLSQIMLVIVVTTLPEAILLWTEPDVPVEAAL